MTKHHVNTGFQHLALQLHFTKPCLVLVNCSTIVSNISDNSLTLGILQVFCRMAVFTFCLQDPCFTDSMLETIFLGEQPFSVLHGVLECAVDCLGDN